MAFARDYMRWDYPSQKWVDKRGSGSSPTVSQSAGKDPRITGIFEALIGRQPSDEEYGRVAPYASDPAIMAAIVSKLGTTTAPQGKYADVIGSQVQNLLGREATPSELDYFGRQMEQGGIDQYGLESFIKGTEEYQTNYAKQAREGLKTELGELDQAYLDRVNKALQAKYSAQGRPGAGAFGSSLIQAGKDLAAQRGSYLADIGYQQALRGQDVLSNQYQANLQNLYNQQQMGQSLGSESRNRYYSVQDQNRAFEQQKQLAALQNQYQQQLLEQQQSYQPSFLQGLIPGVIGGGLGVLGSYLGRSQNNTYNMGGGSGIPFRMG